ncbi:BadF/BadG/BcrA/BcrD ATPase family protein [Cohnella fermenti]|uniref:N-acetylglucosamine kinase n=1 Tax=Cohnella fermenti TaxID=2565925 RepID=A0A4S4BIZ7_9BACL|nr:BadF/BadG/BcrA/BcrD ATPase family protein [Cohnella fermenti]THF74506.1 N-acetylglucosamine kinase [Cohnella fermenti]
MASKGSGLFLGVDGGGTKTTLLVGDGEGRIVSIVGGSSSNLKSRPWDEVRAELSRLVREGLERAGRPIADIAGIALGLAGGDRPEDKKRVAEHLAAELAPGVRIDVFNDAATALMAGTQGAKGMVLISGTGSICCGFDPESGRYVRSGGWGYLLGDEGSGFDLGRQALTAVLKAHDGREEATALTGLILERFGAAHPEGLITSVYEADNPRTTIAAIAPLVLAAARAGDLTASRIADGAAAALAALVVPVAASLRAGEETLPLIVTGGVFRDEGLRSRFGNRPELRGIGLELLSLKVLPVAGSYYMALMRAGIALSPDIINRVSQHCATEGEFSDETIR